MCLQPSLRQRRLELFPRLGPGGPRPQACGVAGKIDSQQFTIIRFPPTVPIICAHAIVAATPAEPSNARKTVIVEQDDVQFVPFLYRSDDLLRHHQIRPIAHQHIDLALRIGHFDAQSAGNFVAHA